MMTTKHIKTFEELLRDGEVEVKNGVPHFFGDKELGTISNASEKLSAWIVFNLKKDPDLSSLFVIQNPLTK